MIPTRTLALAAAAAAAVGVQAATIRIDVGKSGLAFSPNMVTASVGDVLEYHFFAINHSVVNGAFDTPCAPVTSGGFFSGFMPTSGGGENVSAVMRCLMPCLLARVSFDGRQE